MLSVRKLTKWFGERAALREVSFEVARGEIAGFLGPNGAGKTTTLRIIAGYLAPSSGEVRVDGLDALAGSREVRRRMGYLPEGAPLYPDLRVREYLAFRARLKRIGWRARRGAVAESAERAGAADLMDRPIGVLSRGQRQSIGLADALLGRPPLLILDEPTAGLDPHQVQRVRALVRDLADDHAVLLSTHLLPEVAATCTRAVIVHEGRVVHEQSLASLARDALGALDCEMVGPGEEIEAALGRLPGVLQATRRDLGGGVHALRLRVGGGADLRESIGREALRRGWVVRELRPAGETLEDVFVRTTTGERRLEAGPDTTSSGRLALEGAWRARLQATRPPGSTRPGTSARVGAEAVGPNGGASAAANDGAAGRSSARDGGAAGAGPSDPAAGRAGAS